MNEFYQNRAYPPASSDAGYFLDKARKELHKHGVTVGFCLIACIALQYFLSFLLDFVGLYQEYMNNEVFSKAFDILFSVISVFTPFLVAVAFMPQKKREQVTPLGAPVSGLLMAAGVAAGLMFCVVGGDLTSYLADFLEKFNIIISAPKSTPATTFTGKLLFTCSLAVIPPLSEEFALRGVVLQPMRKYGDIFAIVMSSLVFALMHGTALQLPFAFIAGLSLAYFTVATGTMWTGIIIHSLNNLFTAILGLLSNSNPDLIVPFYGAVNTAIFVLGMASSVYFIVSKKKIRLKGTSVNLSLGERLRAFLLNPLMILSFIILIWQTKTFISVGG